MIIQANIGDNEIDFFLERKEKDAHTVEWKGKGVVTNYWNNGGSDNSFHDEIDRAEISFLEEDRIITSIKLTPNITTNLELMRERIVDGINEYYNSLQSGIELEESNSFDLGIDLDKIRIRPATFSCFEIFRRIEQKDIILDPDFQRNFVWDNIRKSRLIESMLLRIPIPSIYFWENKDGGYEVIDGRQRLTTINEFLRNQFNLRNLAYIHECQGMDFLSLPREYSSIIERTQIQSNIIEYGSPENIKYEIFYRINTGGRSFTRQEIRNCFVSRDVREILNSMINSDTFRIATEGTVNDLRMEAQELALSFIAFYFFKENYKENISLFLDESISKLSKIDRFQLNIAREKFFNGLKNSHYIFGRYAFRNVKFDERMNESIIVRKYPVNRTVFINCTLSLANIEHDILMKKKPEYYIDAIKNSIPYPFSKLLIGKSEGNIGSRFFYYFDFIEDFIKKIIGEY